VRESEFIFSSQRIDRLKNKADHHMPREREKDKKKRESEELRS
jgi:hypothetical protein